MIGTEKGAGARQAGQRFEVHNRSEGKSPKTIQWYNQALSIFGAWLKSEGRSTCVNDLQDPEGRAFVLHLQARPGLRGPASDATVNNRIRALKAFFNWLYQEGFTKRHQMERVKATKVTSKIIEILKDEEICRISQTMDPHTPPGARNTAIFSLMVDTGLRLSEVVSLKSRDVHLKDRYVKVLGKGNKERLVAFGANCQHSLIHYASHFRIEAEGLVADRFFLCLDGRPMTGDGLRSLIERLSKASGVPRMHPHLLRHTYVTRFMLNGGDSLVLRQNLGYTTLKMVETYVHLANSLATEASQQFSPLDSMDYPIIRGRRSRAWKKR